MTTGATGKSADANYGNLDTSEALTGPHPTILVDVHHVFGTPAAGVQYTYTDLHSFYAYDNVSKFHIAMELFFFSLQKYK